MKHASSFALGLAACTLAVTTMLVAAPVRQAASQQPAAQPSAQDDPAAPVFAQTCNKCHDASRITASRRTAPEWEEVINKMIEKGATGTEKDFESVYEYLLKYYGKVNMNYAPVDELTMILGLTDKDAQAIIAYRKANGPFADLDAVKKVPEIDAKKLEDHKDAIFF